VYVAYSLAQSSASIAISYVLPVLWMTLSFQLMVLWRAEIPNQFCSAIKTNKYSVIVRSALGAKSAVYDCIV